MIVHKNIELATKEFLKNRENYKVTETSYFSGIDGGLIEEISLRLPNKGNQFAVDLLFHNNIVCYYGDVGTFTFGNGIVDNCVNSAVKFFKDSNDIDFEYWKQKLFSDSDAMCFDIETFKSEVLEYLSEYITDDDPEKFIKENGFERNFKNLLQSSDEKESIDWDELTSFFKAMNHNGNFGYFSGKTFSFRFVYCCYIIQWICTDIPAELPTRTK